MSDIVERLSDEARLQSEWDTWELGHGAPPPAMDMKRACDLLNEAAAEILRLRELTTWRPIETAPKDGTVINIAGGSAVRAAFWDANYDDRFPWRFMDSDEESAMNAWMDGPHGPTHWLPPTSATGDKGMKITPELEAVARAIYEACPLIKSDIVPLPKRPVYITWEDADAEYRNMAFRQARAALTAIREPTDGMAEALANVGGYEGTIDHAKVDIRAVMDYILGGER